MKTNDQEMTNKELQIWIAGELKSFRSHVDGEFKAIRAELKGIESRLDTKIGGVEARLGSLESRVDGLMIGVAVPVAVFVLLAATKWAWDYLVFLKKFREEKHGLRQSGLGLGKSAK